MSDFFAFPTVNSYEEDVFRLTAAGIVTVAALLLALIAAAVLLRPKKERTVRTATKQLVFSGVAMALAIVASEIKFARLPFGGSVTLFSMLSWIPYFTLPGSFWWIIRWPSAPWDFPDFSAKSGTDSCSDTWQAFSEGTFSSFCPA